MTDGMLDDLEFEQKLSDMPDRELMEFIARRTFAMTRTCEAHGKRLAALELQRGPGARVIAGIGAAVGGAMAGLVYGLVTLFRD